MPHASGDGAAVDAEHHSLAKRKALSAFSQSDAAASHRISVIGGRGWPIPIGCRQRDSDANSQLLPRIDFFVAAAEPS